ncbi:hypothetical protein SARC_08930 [Sphaeroforma arctica JP610]|uniref:Uncharacterized protein n=1 Tax=Sphaeroforma arctica JP610 TaxID=667725 RepID=A0A0L0FPC0_9EUKA|nr:hypothetical protein SARC_08930 [Sphaeroforma arctica JP610]KNC78647.1 hypothetical protein SARC_08930 [Sphaeroforma arctica JP610]|eukprot:XP_014152549.1 hypothetical protein SARC_08930 [Sphaeroforma arctica JP610]
MIRFTHAPSQRVALAYNPQQSRIYSLWRLNSGPELLCTRTRTPKVRTLSNMAVHIPVQVRMCKLKGVSKCLCQLSRRDTLLSCNSPSRSLHTSAHKYTYTHSRYTYYSNPNRIHTDMHTQQYTVNRPRSQQRSHSRATSHCIGHAQPSSVMPGGAFEMGHPRRSSLLLSRVCGSHNTSRPCNTASGVSDAQFRTYNYNHSRERLERRCHGMCKPPINRALATASRAAIKPAMYKRAVNPRIWNDQAMITFSPIDDETVPLPTSTDVSGLLENTFRYANHWSTPLLQADVYATHGLTSREWKVVCQIARSNHNVLWTYWSLLVLRLKGVADGRQWTDMPDLIEHCMWVYHNTSDPTFQIRLRALSVQYFIDITRFRDHTLDNDLMIRLLRLWLREPITEQWFVKSVRGGMLQYMAKKYRLELGLKELRRHDSLYIFHNEYECGKFSRWLLQHASEGSQGCQEIWSAYLKTLVRRGRRDSAMQALMYMDHLNLEFDSKVVRELLDNSFAPFAEEQRLRRENQATALADADNAMGLSSYSAIALLSQPLRNGLLADNSDSQSAHVPVSGIMALYKCVKALKLPMPKEWYHVLIGATLDPDSPNGSLMVKLQAVTEIIARMEAGDDDVRPDSSTLAVVVHGLEPSGAVDMALSLVHSMEKKIQDSNRTIVRTKPFESVYETMLNMLARFPYVREGAGAWVYSRWLARRSTVDNSGADTRRAQMLFRVMKSEHTHHTVPNNVLLEEVFKASAHDSDLTKTVTLWAAQCCAESPAAYDADAETRLEPLLRLLNKCSVDLDVDMACALAECAVIEYEVKLLLDTLSRSPAAKMPDPAHTYLSGEQLGTLHHYRVCAAALAVTHRPRSVDRCVPNFAHFLWTEMQPKARPAQGKKQVQSVGLVEPPGGGNKLRSNVVLDRGALEKGTASLISACLSFPMLGNSSVSDGVADDDYTAWARDALERNVNLDDIRRHVGTRAAKAVKGDNATKSMKSTKQRTKFGLDRLPFMLRQARNEHGVSLLPDAVDALWDDGIKYLALELFKAHLSEHISGAEQTAEERLASRGPNTYMPPPSSVLNVVLRMCVEMDRLDVALEAVESVRVCQWGTAEHSMRRPSYLEALRSGLGGMEQKFGRSSEYARIMRVYQNLGGSGPLISPDEVERVHIEELSAAVAESTLYVEDKAAIERVHARRYLVHKAFELPETMQSNLELEASLTPDGYWTKIPTEKDIAQAVADMNQEMMDTLSQSNLKSRAGTAISPTHVRSGEESLQGYHPEQDSSRDQSEGKFLEELFDSPYVSAMPAASSVPSVVDDLIIGLESVRTGGSDDVQSGISRDDERQGHIATLSTGDMTDRYSKDPFNWSENDDWLTFDIKGKSKGGEAADANAFNIDGDRKALSVEKAEQVAELTGLEMFNVLRKFQGKEAQKKG